ncbi:MAG: bifunctional precorrin-2 dehydrogenase/sirohydrochlorin ferrochelatase, partial [Desulfatiglandales bacterium]
MSYYPILLDLQNERVVVVGGGKVGERKVISLLKAKARVQLVSREITPLLRDLAQSSLIEYLGPEFREDLLDGAKIVIAATDDEGLNRRIFEVCRQKGIWINVVDDPSLCSFLVPSVIQRGSLILAVSTGGKSPAFSKFLRETIEKILPKGIEPLLELMGLLRERVIG